MIEDKEEQLEEEIRKLEKQLKENHDPELEKQVEAKRKELNKLLDYDMMLDTL